MLAQPHPWGPPSQPGSMGAVSMRGDIEGLIERMPDAALRDAAEWPAKRYKRPPVLYTPTGYGYGPLSLSLG
jgi:hypothetical protein